MFRVPEISIFNEGSCLMYMLCIQEVSGTPIFNGYILLGQKCSRKTTALFKV